MLLNGIQWELGICHQIQSQRGSGERSLTLFSEGGLDNVWYFHSERNVNFCDEHTTTAQNNIYKVWMSKKVLPKLNYPHIAPK